MSAKLLLINRTYVCIITFEVIQVKNDNFFIGKLNYDLKVTELNPLTIEAWFSSNSNKTTTIILKHDAIDFLTDLKNGRQIFWFAGHYINDTTFTANKFQAVHPVRVNTSQKKNDIKFVAVQ